MFWVGGRLLSHVTCINLFYLQVKITVIYRYVIFEHRIKTMSISNERRPSDFYIISSWNYFLNKSLVVDGMLLC